MSFQTDSQMDARLRPPIPDSAHITRMDAALDWIPLIPKDRYVLRRIVEIGTHQDLLRQQGAYARLWDRQSGGFAEAAD